MVSWSSYLDGLISRGSFLPDYYYYEVDRGSSVKGGGCGWGKGVRRNKKYITFSSSSDSLTGTGFGSLFKAMIVFSYLISAFGRSFIFIGLIFFFFQLGKVLGSGEYRNRWTVIVKRLYIFIISNLLQFLHHLRPLSSASTFVCLAGFFRLGFARVVSV